MTPEKVLDKVRGGLNKDEDGNDVYYLWEVLEAMKQYAILQLKQHIEHPTKPGYKRHDILEKIKELEK
jgi:ppGpp synthetase/RelA/SpoT-type nucleotidyltranferase